MLKGRIYRNAAAAVAQVIATGAILIVLYRYLLDTLGVVKLGTWSIVMAATSVTRLGEGGFSGSVVKFVAKYVALKDPDKTDEAIQTGVICAGIGVGAVLLIVYLFVDNILSHLASGVAYHDALSIIPYAMASLWLGSLSGAYQAGLDGFQRIDLRNVLLIVGGMLYLLAAMTLIPDHGLLGLAYAQVFQAVVMLLVSWAMLRREFPDLSVLPRWHKHRFAEMWRYSFQFQFAAIAGMLFDPVTKVLLSKFGGLAMVGYYEMASRLVLQIRSMIVSASQVVVPVIAGMHETAPGRVTPMYRKSVDVLLFFSLPMFALVFSGMPLISELWIGHYESNFVIYTGILLVGWLANTLSAPAFFANQGTGRLGWNSIGQTVIGGVNFGLGLVLGYLYQGTGVIAAWGAALVFGSAVVIASFHYRHGIPLGNLMSKGNVRLALSSIGAAATCVVTYYLLHSSLRLMTLSALIGALFTAIVLPAVWRHPVRWEFRVSWRGNDSDDRGEHGKHN